MSKFKLSIGAFAMAMATLPSASVSAAVGVIPPATSDIQLSCALKNPNGGVQMHASGAACTTLNTWRYSRFALDWTTNPGGVINVAWRSTAPSGSDFAARALSYDGTGNLFDSGGWIIAGGVQNQTITLGGGNVILEVAMRTNSSSSLPELHYISNSLQ